VRSLLCAAVALRATGVCDSARALYKPVPTTAKPRNGLALALATSIAAGAVAPL
jgi:hypothetical protein